MSLCLNMWTCEPLCLTPTWMDGWLNSLEITRWPLCTRIGMKVEFVTKPIELINMSPMPTKWATRPSLSHLVKVAWAEGSEGKLGQNCHQIHWGQCPLRRIWKTTQREQVFWRWGWFHGCKHGHQPCGLRRDKKQRWPMGGVVREALFLVKSDGESCAALETILASLGLDSERILRNHCQWRLSGNYLPVDCSSSVNC